MTRRAKSIFLGCVLVLFWGCHVDFEERSCVQNDDCLGEFICEDFVCQFAKPNPHSPKRSFVDIEKILKKESLLKASKAPLQN